MTKDEAREILQKLSNGVLTFMEAEAIDCAIQALGDGSIQSEWQKCPKCDGQGIVSKPPWIAGDVFYGSWSDTIGQHQCNVCNGLMIIPSPPKPKQP